MQLYMVFPLRTLILYLHRELAFLYNIQLHPVEKVMYKQ